MPLPTQQELDGLRDMIRTAERAILRGQNQIDEAMRQAGVSAAVRARFKAWSQITRSGIKGAHDAMQDACTEVGMQPTPLASGDDKNDPPPNP